MGREISGKKSPGVMTLAFSMVQAGVPAKILKAASHPREMIAILIREPGALNNKSLPILFSKGFRPSCQVDLAGGRGNDN
jgi:hypothetical protein